MIVNLNGKVALVTGGSRGIGKAIVTALADAGAKVVINYQRDTAAAENTLSEVKDKGGEGVIYQADITSLEECENLVKATLDHFGRIDILVNNAGVRR